MKWNQLFFLITAILSLAQSTQETWARSPVAECLINVIRWPASLFQSTPATEIKIPDSAAAFRYRNLSISEFETIEIGLIKEVRPLKQATELKGDWGENEFGGRGFYKLLSGKYQGKNVFIKFPSRNLIEQLRLYKLLGDMGIGPKVHGVTSDQSGKTGIVLDFVPGVHFDARSRSLPDSYKVSMETYKELVRIKDALETVGLVYGGDVQLRIRSDGRPYLIDPEALAFERPTPNLRPMGPIAEIDIILSKIRAILEERGKWSTGK